ncbi:MAG: hypothetical protein QXW94_04445 [Desulfurococcaceae archaeon]
MKALAEHIGVAGLQFEDMGNGFYRWTINSYCPFYSKADNTCRINEEKPLACKIFPLLVNTTTYELLVSSACFWIKENKCRLAEFARNTMGTFPLELKAVRELLSIVFGAKNGNVVSAIFTAKSTADAINILADKCKVLKLRESNYVKGLALIILSCCTTKNTADILQSLGENLKLLYIGDLRIGNTASQ